jgi:DNA-binding MarR family transcriptional regulator
MKKWGFVTNYAVVLTFLNNFPTMTAREMAEKSGVTERHIRKIIADLENDGYIWKEKQGRRIYYHINPASPVLGPNINDMVLGDLIKVLGGTVKNRQKNQSNDNIQPTKKSFFSLQTLNR